MIRLCILCCFFLVGCSVISVDPRPISLSSEISNEAATHWSQSDIKYRIRLSGEVLLDGKAFTFQGLMHLDNVARTARLVVFSELATKLFDVSVLPDGEQVHSTLPSLGLTEVRKSVVKSVQRMLLAYQPLRSDSVQSNDEQRILKRCEEKICLTNTFRLRRIGEASNGYLPAEDKQSDEVENVLRKDCLASVVRGETNVYNGSSLLWRATYSKHTAVGSYWLPTTLEYSEMENNEMNARVTLIFVSVSKGEKK